MKKLVTDLDGVEWMLDISRQTILKHRSEVRICPRLIGMPDPFQIRPRLLWWVADIEAWSESSRTFRPVELTDTQVVTFEVVMPPTQQKRGRGRPRNAEKFGGTA